MHSPFIFTFSIFLQLNKGNILSAFLRHCHFQPQYSYINFLLIKKKSVLTIRRLRFETGLSVPVFFHTVGIASGLRRRCSPGTRKDLSKQLDWKCSEQIPNLAPGSGLKFCRWVRTKFTHRCLLCLSKGLRWRDIHCTLSVDLLQSCTQQRLGGILIKTRLIDQEHTPRDLSIYQSTLRRELRWVYDVTRGMRCQKFTPRKVLMADDFTSWKW